MRLRKKARTPGPNELKLQILEQARRLENFQRRLESVEDQLDSLTLAVPKAAAPRPVKKAVKKRAR